MASPRHSLLAVTAIAVGVLCAPVDGWQKAKPGDRIFDIGAVHKIQISVSAAEWLVLQTSSARNGGSTGGTDYRATDGRLIHVGSGFGGYFPWAHADLRVGNTEFKDVGIRYKGNSSFTSTSAAAPLFANFKMKIDLHGTKGAWDGEKTFNFHAGVIDTSRSKEALGYSIFRAAGVPAPRTSFAELTFTVPGIYQSTSAGLFVIIEDVNNTFAERTLPPGTGLFMKPEGLRGGIQSQGDAWSAYESRFRPDRVASAHEQRRVMEFSQLISQSDVALFRSRVGDYLDIDEFLRFAAVNAFISNTDSYLWGGHNYYLYLDPADDKFRFLPWDLDLSMGGRFTLNVMNGNANVPQGPDILRPFSGDHPLIYWLLDDATIAARYRTIVRELAGTVFARAELYKTVETLEKAGAGRATSVRPFIDQRTAYLEQLIASWK